MRKTAVQTVEYGIMTADLIPITSHPEPKMVTGLQFMDAVAQRMKQIYG